MLTSPTRIASNRAAREDVGGQLSCGDVAVPADTDARPTGPLPAGPGWAYEFKWDGVRALAVISGGTTRLYARSGRRGHRGLPRARRARPLARRTPCWTARSSCWMRPGGRLSRRWPSGCTCASRPGRRGWRRRCRSPTWSSTCCGCDGADLTGRPYAGAPRPARSALALAGPPWLVPPVLRRRPGHRGRRRENALGRRGRQAAGSLYQPGPALAGLDQGQARARPATSWSAAGGPASARARRACWSACPADGGLRLPRPGRRRHLRAPPSGSCSPRCGPLASPPSPFADAVPREDARGAVWVRPGAGGGGAVRQPYAGRPAAVPAVPAHPARQDARGRVDDGAMTGSAVEVEGRDLELSNLDKVLYPRPASPRARSSTTTPGSRRCCCRTCADRAADPDPLSRTASRATSFFEKNAPAGTPDWVRTGDAAGAGLQHGEPRDHRLRRRRRARRRWSGWPTWPRSSCTLRSGGSPRGERATPTCWSSTSTRARRPGSPSAPRSRC